MQIEIRDIKIQNRLFCEKTVLELPNHGLYVIHGDNGSGKTLLLRTMFIETNAEACYVSQSNERIIENTGCIENITLFDEDKKKDAIRQLEYFHLEYLMNRDMEKLSGGEKRLVCLLRGFLSEGEFLFIDEPTNDIDLKNIDRLLDLLRDFKKINILLLFPMMTELMQLLTKSMFCKTKN